MMTGVTQTEDRWRITRTPVPPWGPRASWLSAEVERSCVAAQKRSVRFSQDGDVVMIGRKVARFPDRQAAASMLYSVAVD